MSGCRTRLRARSSSAAAQARDQAAALSKQTAAKIAAATKKIEADNGLLARERALDTLSRQNSGFLLRRLLLWSALMFIDLAPVLLKTFSPGTVYDVLQRNAAVRMVRNSRADAAADSDHESRKQAITRDFDLKSHQAVTEAELPRAHRGAVPGPADHRRGPGRVRRWRRGWPGRPPRGTARMAAARMAEARMAAARMAAARTATV